MQSNIMIAIGFDTHLSHVIDYLSTIPAPWMAINNLCSVDGKLVPFWSHNLFFPFPSSVLCVHSGDLDEEQPLVFINWDWHCRECLVKQVNVCEFETFNT